MLWNSQNAIVVSKQLDFKQQKQLKHPAMVPRNGDIYKDAVHTLRSSVHPLFFSNTSRQFGRSKANFGNLSFQFLYLIFFTFEVCSKLVIFGPLLGKKDTSSIWHWVPITYPNSLEKNL